MKRFIIITVFLIMLIGCKSIPKEFKANNYILYQGNITGIENRIHYFSTNQEMLEHAKKIHSKIENESVIYDYYHNNVFITQRFYDNNPKEKVFFDFNKKVSWLDSNPSDIHKLSITDNSVYFMDSTFLDEMGNKVGLLQYYYDIKTKKVILRLYIDKQLSIKKTHLSNEKVISIYRNTNQIGSIRYCISNPFDIQVINK